MCWHELPPHPVAAAPPAAANNKAAVPAPLVAAAPAAAEDDDNDTAARHDDQDSEQPSGARPPRPGAACHPELSLERHMLVLAAAPHLPRPKPDPHACRPCVLGTRTRSLLPATDAGSDDACEEAADAVRITANARAVSSCGRPLLMGGWRGCCKSPW
jgi:hypothetical protein